MRLGTSERSLSTKYPLPSFNPISGQNGNETVSEDELMQEAEDVTEEAERPCDEEEEVEEEAQEPRIDLNDEYGEPTLTTWPIQK